jgi:ankyrin repeat protein
MRLPRSDRARVVLPSNEEGQMSSQDIFELIDSGDSEGLRALLSVEPSAATRRTPDGQSALMRAAYRNSELVKIVHAATPPLDSWDRILVGKADDLPPPDAWSTDGFTPLHVAAFSRNVAATRALLEAGADPNVISKATFAKVTPLGTAVFVGSLEVARELLAHGADPSVPEGSSPIDTARAKHQAELLQLLLSAKR